MSMRRMRLVMSSISISVPAPAPLSPPGTSSATAAATFTPPTRRSAEMACSWLNPMLIMASTDAARGSQPAVGGGVAGRAPVLPDRAPPLPPRWRIPPEGGGGRALTPPDSPHASEGATAADDDPPALAFNRRRWSRKYESSSSIPSDELRISFPPEDAPAWPDSIAESMPRRTSSTPTAPVSMSSSSWLASAPALCAAGTHSARCRFQCTSW
mmetsp:Transcript_10811/g.34411  ORF Transcript_10811/g.34411 Transcript_10811/m.34411 type:complete len:213 (+) Transcript_10811:157-795(+)